MIDRTWEKYADGVLVESGQHDITWDDLRSMRDCELRNSDWRFMSDQSPSEEWVAYRAFLRELPQNFPHSANDAADAWNEYEKPEGA